MRKFGVGSTNQCSEPRVATSPVAKKVVFAEK
jgi:hypothetical protein